MLRKKITSILKRDALLYVVFFTGAVILAVEIMAVRILSPFFGNTIFSFSSVISVILAALSVGYWHGGRMADRIPETRQFYTLVARAGWAVIVVQVVSAFVLLLVASTFSITMGPLVASIVLFFYPSYLFGLLSPYVIKLRSMALPERGVGAVSGEVFFASTLGSIFGSLLSGFMLVPYVGISVSMLTMGGAVVLLGLAGRYMAGDRGRTQLATAVVFLVLVLYVLLFTRPTTIPLSVEAKVLFSADGRYELIRVVEREMYGEQGRLLMLDSSLSSGVTLPDGELLFPYTKYYRLYRFFHPGLERALVLGAGTGTVAKQLLEDYPAAIVDMVDVEPLLFSLSHEYFFLPESEQLREHVQDGRQFLRAADEEQYDFVFGDMYSSLFSVPWHVSTKEFYQLLHSRMKDGGVYVGNYIAALDATQPSLFASTLRTIREVFQNVYVFGVNSPESSDAQNIIILAVKGEEANELLTTQDLIDHHDPALRQFASKLVAYNPDMLSSHAIFTDERAPVEVYTAALISKFDR